MNNWKKLPLKHGIKLLLKENLSYTKILQGPNEAFADFLARLGVTISHNAAVEEARVQLEKLLTYENANQECQRAIAPIRETGNVIDYLKACHNLGSKTQKMQMLAEAMVATYKKKNGRCFVCRDKSHLKRIAHLFLLPYLLLIPLMILTDGFGNTNQKQSLWTSIIPK